jgi:hypothetical protein
MPSANNVIKPSQKDFLMSKFTEFDPTADITIDKNASDRYSTEYWKLLKALTFYYNVEDTVMRVVVPKGFLFASRTIPTKYWNIASMYGRYPQISILHEYLCEYGLVTIKGKQRTIELEQSYRLLYQAVRVLNVGREGYAMMISIGASKFASGSPRMVDEVKNNLDNKLYGNTALQNIRSMLQREELATC